MDPQKPALTIAEQNQLLRDFIDGWSNGVFITDYTMQDAGKGFARPVGGSRETTGAFVGAFFNRMGADPTPIQRAILDQIEKHKFNYGLTIANIHALNEDEIGLAIRNHAIINAIIAIAEHRFADKVSRVPGKLGDVLQHRFIAHIANHTKRMTPDQRNSINNALCNGSDPVDPIEKEFISILPLVARFARSYPLMDWKEFSYLKEWAERKGINDHINGLLARISDLTDHEYSELAQLMPVRRLYDFMVTNPNARVGKFLAHNFDFQNYFMKEFGNRLVGKISPAQLDEIQRIRPDYKPAVTAAQFMAQISYDTIRTNFTMQPDAETFLNALFADQNFIHSPHFTRLLVTYDHFYQKAKHIFFEEADHPFHRSPEFVKSLLSAAKRTSLDMFLAKTTKESFKTVLDHSEDKGYWLNALRILKPEVLAAFKQDYPALFVLHGLLNATAKDLHDWLKTVDVNLLKQQLGPVEALDPAHRNIARLVPVLYPDAWQSYKGLPLSVGTMTLEQYRLYMTTKPVFTDEEECQLLLRVTNENPLNLPLLAEMIGLYPSVALNLLQGDDLRNRTLFVIALLKSLPEGIPLDYISIREVIIGGGLKPADLYKYLSGLRVDAGRAAILLSHLGSQHDKEFINIYEANKGDKYLETILTKTLVSLVNQVRTSWQQSKSLVDVIFKDKPWSDYFSLSRDDQYKVREALRKIKSNLEAAQFIHWQADKLAEVLPHAFLSVIPTDLQKAINTVGDLKKERNAVDALEALINGPVPAPDLSRVDDKLPIRFLNEDLSASNVDELKRSRIESIGDLKRFNIWTKGLTLKEFETRLNRWVEWMRDLQWPTKEKLSDQFLIDQWRVEQESIKFKAFIITLLKNPDTVIPLEDFDERIGMEVFAGHSWEVESWKRARLHTLADLKRFKLWTKGMTCDQFVENHKAWTDWMGKMTDDELAKLSDADLLRLWNNRGNLQAVKNQLRG